MNYGIIVYIKEDIMKRSKIELTNNHKDVLEFMKELKANPDWYTYPLTRLTEWGFWSEAGGESMVSIDDEMGIEIVRELNKFLEYAPNHFIDELHEFFSL